MDLTNELTFTSRILGFRLEEKDLLEFYEEIERVIPEDLNFTGISEGWSRAILREALRFLFGIRGERKLRPDRNEVRRYQSRIRRSSRRERLSRHEEKLATAIDLLECAILLWDEEFLRQCLR
jgi:hypothetical protein